jgi:hypothetical protein
MSREHTDLYDQIRAIIKAWTLYRPQKSYGGLSLDDFKSLVAPSGDARTEVAQCDAKAQEAKAHRKDADKLSRKYVQRVVSGVKADAEDGEDSEIYVAMGYVPRSVRNSLRSLRRKDAAKVATETKTPDAAPKEVNPTDKAA